MGIVAEKELENNDESWEYKQKSNWEEKLDNVVIIQQLLVLMVYVLN